MKTENKRIEAVNAPLDYKSPAVEIVSVHGEKGFCNSPGTGRTEDFNEPSEYSWDL